MENGRKERKEERAKGNANGVDAPKRSLSTKKRVLINGGLHSLAHSHRVYVSSVDACPVRDCLRITFMLQQGGLESAEIQHFISPLPLVISSFKSLMRPQLSLVSGCFRYFSVQ